jgi:aerobic-type carbon monoxide dehydrogenase small subunit (CoxS/CutS family)
LLRWSESERVELMVNREQRQIDMPVRASLADAVRALGLTGTRVGWEHGVCGSCTVLLDGEPVRSCLVLAVQADGRDVRTVEGLANGDELHPVQQAFHERRAVQCGYCTPGFVMLAVGLLEREPAASEERVREVLSASLCRCTGYAPIVEAVLAAQHNLLERPR